MAERAAGPVRTRFDGDRDAARDYTGVARTQLGILKENMRMGNLAQLSRTIELTDGTKIFVSSIHGQDTMRIEAPTTASAAVAGTATTSGTTPENYAYIAGFGLDPATGLTHAFRAKIGVTGSILEALDLGVLSGGLYFGDGRIAMTADGSVIVYADFDSASGGYNLYRWTAAIGTVFLGLALGVSWGWRGATTTAFSMSADGSAITYTGWVGGNWQQVYWSSSAGARVISPAPQQYLTITWHYTQASPAAQGISADGSTVLFYYQVPITVIGGTTALNTVLYRWTAGTGATIVGFVGDANTPAFPGPLAQLSADGSTIFASSGLGTRYAPANTIVRWSGGIFTNTGVSFSTGDYFMVSSNGAVLCASSYPTLYRWTAAGPATIDTSSVSIPAAMTPDGSAIAYSTVIYGTSVTHKLWTAATGVTVLRNTAFTSYMADLFLSADGSAAAFTTFEPAQRAWKWSKGVATELIGAIGFGAAATGMGPDGATVAGIADTAGGLRVAGWASAAGITKLGGDPRGAFGTAAAMSVTKVFQG